MPYDEELAARLRELLADEDDVTEQRMFGGLAFLLGGHIAVAASGKGGLMARIDPAEADKLTAKDGVARMVMGGREMDGWLRVDAEQVRTRRRLEPWVRRGRAVARGLPPKA